MIVTHYVEIRSRRGPGNTAPTTIIREIQSRNGKGKRTTRVLRGNRVISDVSEPLRPSEKLTIQKRTFSPGLYASADKKIITKMNKKTRKHSKHS